MCSTQEQSSIIWLPVSDYEGFYEVSNTGLVRSVDRVVTGIDGINYPRKGRVLKPNPHKDTQYLIVSLWKENVGTSFYVHRLVCTAFHPNLDNKPEVNHINGIRYNNYSDNLEWSTRTENADHAIQTGLKTYTNRLTKAEFIECLFAVIEGESYASLSQRVPYRVPYLSVKVRQYAKELNVEAELDASLMIQRIERAKVNGAKNTRWANK